MAGALAAPPLRCTKARPVMAERALLRERGMRALVISLLLAACGTTPAVSSERQPAPAVDAGVTTTSAVEDKPADGPAMKPRSAAEAAGRNAQTPPEQGDVPRGSSNRDVPGPLAPTAPAETRDPAPKLR